MVEISTSILSIEKEKSIQKFYDLEVAHTDYFHIDVMDGKFVQKDTTRIMEEYTNEIKQISNIPLDVHLMVENVKEYVDNYIAVNPNRITFHYEALKAKEKIMKMIAYIKENDIKVGISICPDTRNRKNKRIFAICSHGSSNDRSTWKRRAKINTRNARKNTKFATI